MAFAGMTADGMVKKLVKFASQEKIDQYYKAMFEYDSEAARAANEAKDAATARGGSGAEVSAAGALAAAEAAASQAAEKWNEQAKEATSGGANSRADRESDVPGALQGEPLRRARRVGLGVLEGRRGLVYWLRLPKWTHK